MVKATEGSDWLLWREYPSIFAAEQLGLQVDEQFAWFLDCKDEEQLLLWSRQTGKTTGAAAKVTHQLIFYPETLSLIVSASQKQASRLQHAVTRFLRMYIRNQKGSVVPKWQEIPGRDAEMPVDTGVPKLVRVSSLSLELGNGSEVISVPASPDTVRGYSPQRIVFDEAAYAPDEVYYGAVRPMRAVTMAPLSVMSSAGFMRGFFWTAWTKEEHWAKLEIKATGCPRIRDGFLDQERAKMPFKVWQREYDNVFMPLAGGVFDQETIDAMFGHEEIEAINPGVKYAMGWDIFNKDVEAVIPEFQR